MFLARVNEALSGYDDNQNDSKEDLYKSALVLGSIVIRHSDSIRVVRCGMFSASYKLLLVFRYQGEGDFNNFHSSTQFWIRDRGAPAMATIPKCPTGNLER